MMLFTRYPIDRTPRRLPPSITGRCRTRLSVMSAIPSSPAVDDAFFRHVVDARLRSDL
jgi:hypothetical protein